MSRTTKRLGMNIWAQTSIAVIVASVLTASGMARADTTYTLDAEFDQGNFNGVNHDAPNNDQLQLNETGTTFPVIWIANAGQDTVSRIATDIPSAQIPSGGCEVARYRTRFGVSTHLSNAFSGPAPSRTAVDIDGNMYVANRHFDGLPAEVMKVLAEGGIDRNGNGVIDTSTDTNGDCFISDSEMMPVMVDSNFNGLFEQNEITDERIAWIRRVGPSNGLGRSLCIDGNGDLWAGLFNRSEYYKVSAATGNTLAGPISISPLRPYGCLVDGQGRLFSAGLSTLMGELNTTTATTTAVRSHSAQGSNYGIALGNSKVYLGNFSGRTFTEFDPATNLFSTPAWPGVAISTLGIAVDGNGRIVAGSSSSGGGVFRFNPNGTVFCTGAKQAGATGEVRGMVVDADNNFWTVHRVSNNIAKYGANCEPLGVKPVGARPYTYSDASGFGVRTQTDPSGIFTVTEDSGAADTEWTGINWNQEPEGNVPAGASIEVEARAANLAADLAFQTFTMVTNGGPLSLMGQFIGIRVTLRPNDDDVSPVLSDLTVQMAVVSDDLVCDVDGSGVIDINDIRAIMAARNTPASGPDDPRDPDGDGIITANDARQCVLQCTNSRCAP